MAVVLELSMAFDDQCETQVYLRPRFLSVKFIVPWTSSQQSLLGI